MEKIFLRLRRTDLAIRNMDVFSIVFENESVVDYRSRGRKRHILHFITAGRRSYEIGGRQYVFGKNTLLLIPDGTKYITRAHAADGVRCAGISIDFECAELFPDEEKRLYHLENVSHAERVGEMFRAVHRAYSLSPLDVLAAKTAMYNLLFFLCDSPESRSAEHAHLEPAIRSLSETYARNLPVKHYADLCNWSESYFRKRFAAYMGMPPLEYRNKLRFAEAKSLYRQGLSTQEIAERTGFCDAGNLLRTYRRYNGASLKNDAQNI